MIITKSQLEDISRGKIKTAIKQIHAYIKEQVDQEVLIYDDENITLIDFIKLRIEDALVLNLLNEAGVVKFIFLTMIMEDDFFESEEFQKLKNELLMQPTQFLKNVIIDDFVYEVTDYGNYWKS